MTVNIGVARRYAVLCLSIFIVAVQNNSYVRHGKIRCSISADSRAADCSYRSLLKPPLDLPASVDYLDLSNNILDGSSLLHLGYLKSLRYLKLNSNRIEVISDQKFPRLSSLETLLLARNPLMVIEETLFKKLPALKYIHIDHHNLLCNSKIIPTLKWLLNIQTRVSLLPSGNSTKCYDTIHARYETVSSLDTRKFENELKSDTHNRRSKRSTTSLVIVQWSCNLQEKIILLYNSTLSTNDSRMCNDYCFGKGYSLMLLDASTCLCGEEKSPKAYKINDCTYKCQKVTQSSGCDLKRRSYEELSATVGGDVDTKISVASDLSDSILSTMAKISNGSPEITSTVKTTGNSLDAALNDTSLQPSPAAHYTSNHSISTVRTKSTAILTSSPVLASSSYIPNSQTATPVFQRISFDERTRYVSPKISTIPVTSHTITYVASTIILSKEPEVVNTDHRSIRGRRGIGSLSSSSANVNAPKLEVITSRSALTFTNGSSYRIVFIAVNVSFSRDASVYLLRYFIKENSINPESAGINITGNNRIAVPVNTAITISLSFAIEKENGVVVQSRHDGLVSNLSLSAGNSGNYSWQASSFINSGIERPFIYQLRFLDNGGRQLVNLQLNFTSMEPIQNAPKNLIERTNYTATYEYLHFAFGTNYSFVEAVWTVFQYSNSNPVEIYRNTTACSNICPASVGNCLLYTCIIHMAFFPRNNGNYAVELIISNPVTSTALKERHSFTAETRITKLSISACDYSGNVNQSKKFNLISAGSINSIQWLVNGLSIANNTHSINHTATSLRNYTLTVKAHNHINAKETSVYIRVYQWGSVHGLTITTPDHDSYHATLKDVSFSAELCDGDQPMFYWDFGDGSNATTTLSSIKHTFILPKKYTITLRVDNAQDKTETTSLALNLQDEIRNLTASPSKTIVAVDENLFVRTHIDKGTSVTYKIERNHVQVPDFNANVSKAFHFKQAGRFELKITASNKVSKGGPVSVIVYVQEMIKLSLEQKLHRVLNNVESFSARRLLGTNMYTKWDFGDGYGTNFTYTDRAGPTAEHTYQNEGKYTVILFAKNDVQGEVNYTSLFYVERPLTNGVSFAVPQYASTNVTFLVNISVQHPSIYGYNATLAERRYLLSERFHQINVTLGSAKTFTLTLRVWNHVSSLSLNGLIIVQDAISSEVKIAPMYVPVSTTVQLYAVVQGSDPVFSWQFQDLNYSKTGDIIHHAFSNLGVAYFNVTASNKVSSFTSQLKVHVQLNITNLSLHSNASFTAPNATVLIMSSLPVRPEHVYSWKVNGSVLNESGGQITYAFPSLGKYWVSLNMTNDISSQVATIDITVQEPIRGTSISLPKNLSFIPFNETVTLEATSASGNSMTFTWCVESKCVNGSKRVYNIIVLKLDVFYINVTVIIENEISKDSSTELIPVVQRIEDLHLKVTTYRGNASPYLTIINRLVGFEAGYSTGNHFSVEWRIAGTLVHMNETKLTYNFTQPGDFKVEVLLRNSINSDVSTVNVTVVSTFDIIDITPRLVETNQSTVFSIIDLTQPDVRLEWLPPEETGSQALANASVTLNFKMAGIYPLFVKGSNLLIQVNKTFYITVQDRVTSLNVMPKTKFYRTTTRAYFNASVASGTNVTFTWKLATDSISCQNADQPRLSCQLTTWGRYRISVNASNLINSLQHAFYIYIQDAVQIINLTSIYGTVLPTYEKLILEAAILGTNVSDASSLQDNDKGHIEYFGNRTSRVLIRSPGTVGINITAWNEISLESKVFSFTVQERLVDVSIWTAADFVPAGETVRFQAVPINGTDLLFSWYVNSSKLLNNTDKTLDYRFEKQGTYEVKVDVKNAIIGSLISSREYIRVALPACVPPKISIHGGERRTLSRSQWLYFEASIDYNCSTSSVSSSWSLKTAKESTSCMIEGESLTSFSLGPDVDLTATMLAIQPGQLQVGTYCLYYIAKYGLNRRFIIFSASFLKVIPTPPVPVILGGIFKMVGQNQSFILDGSESIDPDNQQPTELLFRWSCTLHKESVNSTELFHTGCKNTPWLPWNDGKQLAVNARSLVAGSSYNFVLSVKRPGRTPYSTSQKVAVLSMTMPDIFIKCVTCGVYKTSKYITNRSLKLLGTCSNCDTDFGRILTLNTHWLVTSSNGTMTLNITKSQTKLTDLLIILPGRLDGLSTYSIKFSVTVQGDIVSSGNSEILLNPNHGPENGSCTIEPLIGVTLETKFTFKCTGWMDDDNANSPLIYWLRFQTSTGSWDILYRGIRNSVSVYLPVGDSKQQGKLRLQILIEDIHGAQSVGLERMVTVNPPKEDPTEFLNANVISSINLLTSEKDTNKVVAVTQASVKLLNESGPIGTRQESILSSVTESASQMSAPSLEAVDQLSNALRSSVGLVNENAFQSQTRQKLTTSLEKMINKVDVFASKGQLADQTSLKSLLFLAQNNIASDSLRNASGGRVRRAISQMPSEIMKNLNLVMQLYMAILRTRIRGEEASTFSNKYGKVILKRDSSALLNKTLNAEDCSFVLKKSLITHSDIFQVFNVSYNDPFMSPSPIESKIAGLGYSTANGTQVTVKDLPYNESILIKLGGSTSRKKAWSIASSKIIKAKASIDGEMTVTGLNTTATMLIVEVISNMGPIGSIDAYLKPKSNHSAVFWLNNTRHGSLIKHFHAGEFNASERYQIKISNNNDKQDANVSLLVFSSSCVFWDRNNETWNSEGVTPTEETNIDFTVCRTSHLTSFASTFKIAPNPIRWSTLSEIDVESNPIALVLCLTLVALYILGIFFSARKDVKDRQESHYIPMMGKDGFYKYEVRIKTGSFPGAGTTAHVGLQVYATKGATKPIVVAKKNSFQRNSVDIFRFASATGLGKISRIRIWHDNSGSGPSWYLSRVVIKNLLDGQKYFFFCNRWLAVDRDDGEIERFFHVADSKMMSRFQTIFNDTIGRTFTDYHLWMSVFEKPKLSRFTRVQRLTCCVTFLLSWMSVNAMWYGTVRESVDLYVGFKGYSYEEIIVGIISSLLVFPVNFIIIMVFRNCRLPISRQIVDGDDEIAVHVLSKSHHTRRLSEDSIEIEDATESHALLNTSLPRCGGYFRLMSFNKRPSFQELPSENSVEITFDHDPREVDEHSADSFNAVSIVHKTSSGFSRIPNVLQSGHLYSKLPVSYGTNYEVIDDSERYEPRQGSSRCSTAYERATISTNITTLSSRTGEPSSSFRSEMEIDPDVGSGVRNSNVEYDMKLSALRNQRLSDSFIRKHSNPRANTVIEKDTHHNQISDDAVDDKELTKDLPDIFELDPSLDCLLPSWFVGIAYLACFTISVLSILVILIYGQQFGKDKALSWLQSIFSGLIQDIFVTYPVLLVLVAFFLALIRKPMNLDYSDFVNCPVIPGDPRASSEPVRGYALELAQKQGRGKREIRRILKNLAFQLVHLWLVLSICLTSYESHISDVKKRSEAKLFPGKQGIQEIDSINKLWNWMETDLPMFLYPAASYNEYWILRSEPRLRQVRIRAEKCVDPDTAKTVNNINICNPEFCDADIEKGAFLMNWTKPGLSQGTSWSFKTEEELNGTIYLGRLGVYPHSGYSTILGWTKSQFLSRVISLKAAGWLDMRTRVLFIEFVMQNVNINKYAVYTIAFEFSSTGFVLQQLEIIYLRVHMYITRLDNFRLFCEVMFGLLTFYQLWRIQDKLRRRGRRFFDKFWNIHLLLSFLVNACTVGLSIYRLIIFLELRPFLKTGVPQGYDLRKEAIIDWSIQACFGAVCFILIIKIISLLSWVRSYRVVACTLRRSVKQLLVLVFGFVICLTAFASWGNLAFGSSYYRFQTFWRAALYTLLFRIWDDENESNMPQDGVLIAWKVLFTIILFVFVLSFFRSALFAYYKDARRLYRAGHKRNHGDILKYVQNRLTLRKKKTGKRVKFSLNPSIQRNTLATSQQTISLGSDQWLSSHSLSSYSHIPSYVSLHTMSQLAPITDEILRYVHQLELDDILEDEFYSKLESIANHTRRSKKQPRCAPGNRYVAQKEN